MGEAMLGAGEAATARGLTGVLLAERDRWPLWLPVLLGLGIALYFALPFEPSGAAAAAAAAAFPALGLALVLRAGRGFAAAALTLALVGLGFALAKARSEAVDAPVLARRVGPAWTEGRVSEVEPRPSGARIILDDPVIDGLDAEETPQRVRLVVAAEADLRPGDDIGVRAVLMPPPRPAAPGAYDYARALYFRGIGAVGYAVSRPKAADLREGQGHAAARIAALRLAVAERIERAVAGSSAPRSERRARAAVAVALLTGLRGGIPEAVTAALRDAGLAHLLAISGLHLGLMAGFAFFAVRLALAAVEPMALRYPIKKWAAAVALLAGFAYLLLTGATVPTQRAFVMAALVLLAVMVDREAVSMRPVALAALVVLALRPESLLSASFQLSFGAVVALVAFYEGAARHWPSAGGPPSRWWRAGRYLAAVAATTVVATLATAPFAAFHFNRVATLGLLANLVAVPVMGLWIMPWGLLALAVMPLGTEALALVPMEWGIAAVIAVARACAGLPGAVALLPAWPLSALVAIALGGLWLCLWRRRWRWAGLAGIGVGLALAATPRPPDVLVDETGQLFAVRTADRALALSSTRERFTGTIWLRRNGQKAPAPWADGALRCDSLACLYHPRGKPLVSLVSDPRALAEDCAVADVVVAAVPVRDACRGPVLVIDRFDLWRNGAYAVWLGDEVRAAHVEGRRGARPWARRPQ